mmetsp:Transcript_86860/g.202184  ORF Transcript_86860/g.202184 Transcript_86860/m.202184 type:complete len:338 (-) Transcript_86860:109-1122(-)
MPMQSFEIERPARSPLIGSPFERKEYDVTSHFARLCCQDQKLILEPEEAILQTSTPCSELTKRLPYGELGRVEHATACGFCHQFNSNLSNIGESGEQEPISPGCGCNAELVEEIVMELKARMKGRGDTGNIQRAEEALTMMRQLNGRSEHQAAKIDAILASLSVPLPQEMVDMQQSAAPLTFFGHQEFDVTDTCSKLCTCGISRVLLFLGPEEVVIEATTCCARIRSSRPYGELGHVTEATSCGCCAAVASSLGILSPGCGCQKDLVHEISEELKRRMQARGDTGNLQRQEQTNLLVRELLMRVSNQDTKVDALLRHLKIPVPRPSQQAMNEGGDSP